MVAFSRKYQLQRKRGREEREKEKNSVTSHRGKGREERVL